MGGFVIILLRNFDKKAKQKKSGIRMKQSATGTTTKGHGVPNGCTDRTNSLYRALSDIHLNLSELAGRSVRLYPTKVHMRDLGC